MENLQFSVLPASAEARLIRRDEYGVWLEVQYSDSLHVSCFEGSGKSFVNLPTTCRVIICSSPAESRGYAFFRNMFAIIFTGILITRAVTALLQAGNKFETRIQSMPCQDSDLIVDNMVHILMVRGPRSLIKF